MRAAVVLSLIVSLQTAPSIAGGLFGDALNVIVPGAGTALDDAHRDFKEQVPVYGDVEEGLADGVRKGFEELNGEVDGPILANWIWASRQDVINAGVEPLPPYIYEAMQGYFPEHILQKVRWRTGWGNEIALPALSFRFGDAAAITLDEIVMFRDWDDAQGNLALWAHELTHVVQYDQWGVMDFAKRYVKDYGGVEGEAEEHFSEILTHNCESSRCMHHAGIAIVLHSPTAAGGAGAGASRDFQRRHERGKLVADRVARSVSRSGACGVDRYSPGGQPGAKDPEPGNSDRQ